MLTIYIKKPEGRLPEDIMSDGINSYFDNMYDSNWFLDDFVKKNFEGS